MNSGDDKALFVKKRKKIVKTPSQRQALEKFYDEHKYPTESLKLELSKSIGLTERQVSSWFCHRRLKDKRFPNVVMDANRRQDRSNGVVQDSCESTSQGENKAKDPIEVQSTIFVAQQISSADLKLEHGSRHAGKYSHRDDTSSGGSSSKHNLYSKVDPVTVSKLSARNVVNYVNFGKPRSAPSGYLKVKSCVENPAVTAIKKQLGAHYREDGPPIGIAFDPLPPGAFEPSSQQPDNTPNSSETYSADEHNARLPPVAQGIIQEFISKPYHIEKDNLLHSDDVSRVHKQRIPNSEYACTSNMSFPKTVLGGNNSETFHKSVQPESFLFQKRKEEFSLFKHRSAVMHEDSPPDMAIYERRNNYESRPISGAGGSRRGSPAAHHQFQPYVGEVKKEHVEPLLKNSNGRMPKVELGESLSSSCSDFVVRGRENDACGDKGLPRKPTKVGSFSRVKREIDGNGDIVQPKIPRKKKCFGDDTRV